MLPTVSCPTKRPPKVTTQGTVRPCRASRRIVRAIETYGLRLDRYSGVSGLVGSQARSHPALRTRVSRQAAASLTRTGRRLTGRSSRSGSVRVTGQPRMRPTAPSFPGSGPVRHSVNQRVRPGYARGLEAVQSSRVWSLPRAWSTVCTRTRDSAAIPSRTPPGEAGREDRARDAGLHAFPPDRVGDAGYLPVDHLSRHLRRAVGRRQPGSASGDHDVIAGLDGVQQSGLDGIAVPDHLRAVHLAPLSAQQPHELRP